MTVTTYDWEDTFNGRDDEGFTASDPTYTTFGYALVADGARRGQSVIWTWENDEWDGYDVVQSINSYTTAKVSRRTKNVLYISDSFTNSALIFRDVYGTKRFQGEVKS